MDYKFLGQAYKEYVLNFFYEHGANTRDTPLDDYGTVISDELKEILKMSSEEILQTFILPWKKLDYRQMKAVASIIAEVSNHEFETSIYLNVSKKDEEAYRQLYWLTYHVRKLKLSGFDEAFYADLPDNPMGLEYYKKYSGTLQEPYLQCLYCGQLDQDKREKKFGKKNKYCHLGKCASSSNPEEHVEGCCYKASTLSIKTLKQSLTRHKNSKDKMTDDFFAFIKCRLEFVKTIKHDIRTEFEYKEGY